MASMAGKPSGFVLFYEPLLTGAANVDSVFSEKGPKVGPVEIQSANRGGLIPEFVDSNGVDSDARNVRLTITEGGGLNDAEWVFLPDFDATTPPDARGAHDVRQFGWSFSPFPGGYNAPAICYSSVYHRILVAAIFESGNTIVVRYWDPDDGVPTANDDDSDWMTVTTAPLDPKYDPTKNDHGLAMCELEDGSILLAVQRESSTSNPATVEQSGDIDIYKSVDGGDTFELASEGILQRFIDLSSTTPSLDSMLRMKSSGPWVRIALFSDDNAAFQIHTLASSDGGVTWELVDTIAQAQIDRVTSHADDTVVFDLEGVGDAAGTFILAARDNAGNLDIRAATRDSAWTLTDHTVLEATFSVEFHGIMCARDERFMNVWTFHNDNTTDDDRTLLYRFPLDNLYASSKAEQAPFASHNYRGAERFYPGQASGIWTGSAIGMIFTAMDLQSNDASVSILSGRHIIYQQIGGWSSRPIAMDGAKMLSAGADGQVLNALEWHAWMGIPADGGVASSSTQTTWTASLSGGATAFRQVGFMQIDTYNLGDILRYNHNLTGVSFPAPRWTDHGDEVTRNNNFYLLDFDVNYGAGSAITWNSTAHGVRITEPNNGGGVWKLQIRLASTGILLYDASNTAPLLTLNPAAGLTLQNDTTGAYTRVVFAVSPTTTYTDAPSVTLMASQSDDPFTWYTAGPVDLPAGTATGQTEHEIRFGALSHNTGAGNTTSSLWKRFTVYYQNQRLDYGADPTPATADLPGRLAASRPVYLERGVLARWGGGGGHAGDVFDMEIEHDYPAENIFLDSPRLQWRSATGQTAVQSIIFDAGAGTDEDERFKWESVGLFGLENQRVLVQFSTDKASWSGGGIVNASMVDNVRVASIDGKLLQLEYPSAAEPAPGSLVGKFIRVTAVSGFGINRVFKIIRHDGDYIKVEEGAWSLANMTAGDTVTIFADRAFMSFTEQTARYARLTFGSTGDVGWQDEWVLGGMAAGISMPFRIPFDWSHGEEDFQNTVIYRTRSGVSWAYEEGPIEKVITGRFVGDTSAFRDEFRDLMSNLCGFDEKPMALVINEDGLPDDLMLVRWDSQGLRKDNQAWFNASTDLKTYRTAGDMQVQFREVV